MDTGDYKNISEKEAFIKGIKTAIPVAIGVCIYGIVYGILTREAHTFGEAVAMSMTVFAGLAQFVAIEMWTEPLPVFTLVITAFIVNIRHLLMGASMYPHCKDEPKKKIYPMLFFLVDESWALAMKELINKTSKPIFLLGTGVVFYPAWLISTVVGRIAGDILPAPEKLGIDFAMAAVFLVILVGVTKGKKDLPILISAGIAAFLAEKFLPGKWYILIGGLAGAITGWFKYGK